MKTLKILSTLIALSVVVPIATASEEDAKAAWLLAISRQSEKPGRPYVTEWREKRVQPQTAKKKDCPEPIRMSPPPPVYYYVPLYYYH